MADYSFEEGREQIVKVGHYFARFLREHQTDRLHREATGSTDRIIAARVHGCTIVVVQERDGGPFERYVREQGVEIEKPQRRRER